MTNGWRIARFDEILTKVDRKIIIDDDQEYDTVGVRWYGNGAFVRERLLGVNISRKQQWIIKAGDVVYNKLFAWKNAFAIADESVDGRIVSDKFPTYQTKPDLIDTIYLEYYFKTPQIGTQAQNLSKGAAAISKLTLNPPQFWDLTIPLPSLTEQRRIVAQVEALARRINEAQHLREEADIEANKLLDSALIHLFENSDAPRKSLREVSHFQRGRFSWRPRNDPRFYDGDYPFIQIGDIPRDSKLITSHTQTLNDEGLKISRMFPAGTIVISIAATIGAVGILGFNSCMPDSLVGLNSKPEMAVSDYVYYFLKYSQSHFERIAPQSAQKNINIGILESVSLPTPSLEEQQRIVAYLDGLQAKVNAVRELQSATGEELSALMPSILDRAFKGEL